VAAEAGVALLPRDRLPYGVLTRFMGWSRVERIWLPDWVRDPDEVIGRIVRAVSKPIEAELAPEPARAFARQPDREPESEQQAEDETSSRSSRADVHLAPSPAGIGHAPLPAVHRPRAWFGRGGALSMGAYDAPVLADVAEVCSRQARTTGSRPFR
jgi:hypothetical protein